SLASEKLDTKQHKKLLVNHSVGLLSVTANVDPFIRPYTTKLPVNGISRQLGASREVTEIDYHYQHT
ncbi:MAG: hypothetical protein ACTHY5_11455, partial [Oceanisphaera sp.]|uniref:hypothetical protein n=1 Tax=Oceanisphaera sp. TaxID=1929979 RepID=UPI003F9E30AB